MVVLKKKVIQNESKAKTIKEMRLKEVKVENKISYFDNDCRWDCEA